MTDLLIKAKPELSFLYRCYSGIYKLVNPLKTGEAAIDKIIRDTSVQTEDSGLPVTADVARGEMCDCIQSHQVADRAHFPA